MLGKTLPMSFNPRAREGRDPSPIARGLDAAVSIHAPVKGATVICVRASRISRVSIHAPVKGATSAARGCRDDKSFNPRAREGRDAVRAIATIAMIAFQSTRP